MRLIRITNLLILLCLSFTQVWPQQYETEITKVTDDNGLSPGATFAILQDSVGFIWFGTTDGLYRYDGYNFRIFRKQPEDSNSISDNTIRGLAIDQKGFLWIATQGMGLDCFNPVNENFSHYQHSGNNEHEIAGNSIWAVMVDSKNHIWIGITGEGIDELDPETGFVKHYNPLNDGKKLRQEQIIRKLVEAGDGLIWAAIPDHGFTSINPESGEVINYSPENALGAGLSNALVYDLIIDSQNNIWLSTFGGGINIYHPESGKYSYILQDQDKKSIVSDLCYTLTLGANSSIWLGTEYGLNQIKTSGEILRTYSKTGASGSYLHENRIRKLFIDQEGIIWAGSESGVDKILLRKNFRVFRHNPQSDNSIPDGIVRVIEEDPAGNLWIGIVENGLVKYNPSSGVFQRINLESAGMGFLIENVNALLSDNSRILWLGDWWNGLFQFNLETGRLINISNARTDSNGLNDNRIQAIIDDNRGSLWIGTENGINRYNTYTGEFTLLQHEENNPQSLSGNAIQSNAFLFDREGNLWAGTWSFGLNKLEFQDSAKTHIQYHQWLQNPADSAGINNNNIISLLEDDNDIMWVGTFGGGLNKFNRATNTFKAYTTENGLPNNIVFSIEKDETGSLWLSTDYGISRFDPESETFYNFDASDGLQSNHFFWGASEKTREGEIYFGGINGINSFFPENIKIDTSLVVPKLVDIKLFNKSMQFNRAIHLLDKVEFRYDENFITLVFSALQFNKSRQVEYQYRLKGFDKDWIKIGHNTSASYTNLSPGKYTFMLRATNGYGVWNTEAYTLQLTIHPPWWRTWWAVSLFLCLLASLIYLFVVIRFRLLQRQKHLLEQEVKLRTSEVVKKNVLLEKQTDEIRNQNTLLQNQKQELADKNEKLKATLNSLEAAQRALVEAEKMASLGVLTAGVAHEINNPLNFISIGVENIRSELDDIDKTLLNDANRENIEIVSDMLDHAAVGVERILDITNRLKSYAKHGQQADEFELDEMLTSSVKLISNKIPAYIEIRKNFQPLPKVKGQKYQISQVVINILENAADAISEKETRDKEYIMLSTYREEIDNISYVNIDIENSGPPIPDKIIQKVFDPFFTTKSPNKGTGLGLYLSYNIIKEHKGLFAVENQDGRVKFKISLPV